MKSITWKLIAVTTLVVVGYYSGMPASTIGWVSAVYHLATLALYVVHEKAWERLLTRSRR